MHLEHRHVEKMTHYEGSARVPLIVAGPGIKPHTETTLVSLLDIFASFVDVAGAAPPSFADGFSLLPLLDIPSHDTRRRPPHVAAMAACDSLNAGQFMLREGQWKLITYATGDNARVFPPQLFNVVADPWEMQNVAAANPDVVARMDEALRGEIDYAAVMKEYSRQGHEWATRWTAAFPNDGWKPLLRAAYRDFADSDEQKFAAWLRTGRG